MVLQSGTARVSRALKNTVSKQEKGIDSELIVQRYFEARGYECLYTRLRTPFAEVDLVMSRIKEDRIQENILIEVKSFKSELDPMNAVSYLQKKRIENQKEIWRVHLALVDENARVSVIEDFLV
jgi:Holliday junction resolvase-like predicted endonuclease